MKDPSDGFLIMGCSYFLCVFILSYLGEINAIEGVLDRLAYRNVFLLIKAYMIEIIYILC